MKTLVTLATLVFWFAVGGVKLMAAGQPAKPAAASPATQPAVYGLAEVARHADEKSCWMAIDGAVYDFTTYLPQHPADPQAMLRHCGREASEAFRTKDVGRPHSPYATRLLDTYRIGTLRD